MILTVLHVNLEEVIFEAAALRPGAERPAYLDAACAGQPGMRAQIETLLRSHEVSGFMEEFAGVSPSPRLEHCDDVIGRYRLVEQIGEGGFGVVWMAEQIEPVTRRVALKIIKQGMDTEEVIARFEAERQALAMMDHPNIARVFDAGATERGRPYFVMELVKGVPITQFCDEQTLSTQQRLELFVEACSAINHAHQTGVIHRDIKPSNVMVALEGDKPVPKVIDFGIAKAIEGRLTDRTLFTRFEHFVGTPAYMSPEQTAMSGLDVDTRSDIYALGVLLYELLTGTPPFDTKLLLSSSNDEMRRIIREVEPPKPSARLATVVGPPRTTLARAHRIAPQKLRRLIAPDLDWIVLKALEKDRARRYQTANGLALDVRRFLASEPVSAGPPGVGYRFRKFARRNRVALRVASGIAAVLVAATVLSTSLAIRATKAEKEASQKASDEAVARQEADQARLEAEALSTFFKGVFTSADPSLGNRDMTVAEALNRAIAQMDNELSSHPEQEVDLQGSILWTLHSLGFTRQVIPLQEKRRDYYHRTLGFHHQKALSASLTLAFYYQADLRIEEATELLEELYRYEREGRQKRDMHWVQTVGNLARCYEALGRGDEALKLNKEALAHCRSAHDDAHPMTIRMMEAVGTSLRRAERFPDAKILGEQVVAIRRNQFRRENPHPLFAALWSLSDSYEALGQPDRALEVREEAESIRRSELRELRPEDRGSLYAVTRLKVEDAIAVGRYDEAVQVCRQLVERRRKSGMPVGERPVPEARLANALLLRAAAEPAGAGTGTSSVWAQEADELLNTLLLESVDPTEGAARVDLLSRHCHWREAARLCRPLHDAFPEDPWVLARFGPLLIAAGDVAAHEKLCEELLNPLISADPADLESLLLSLPGNEDGRLLDVIARTVCLRPVSEAHLQWAGMLADRTATLLNDRPYHQFTRGLAAFRHGNDSRAIADTEVIIPILPATAEAGAQAVLAMARARRGEMEPARKALAEGTRRLHACWLSERRIALHRDPHEWLTAQILLSEAKAMVEPGGQ